MTLHGDAVRVLTTWRPPDEQQADLAEQFLALLASDDDALRRTAAPGHITASALVLSADHTSVLLTLHAKASAWFQMGGHCEDCDATLVAAARREASEESGLLGLTLDPSPVMLDIHDVGFCHPGQVIQHHDVRFLAVETGGAEPVVSAESVQVAWWPVDRLPTREPGLVRLVELALDRVAPRPW